MEKQTTVDPATDWKRSRPDIVVYLPRGERDTDNEHFLVFEAPKSDELLAMWTQSSCEGHGDNHLVLARSQDGQTWSAPRWIAGAHPEKGPLQASWGFPLVSKSGRIYAFYTKEAATVDNSRQGSGGMGCLVSDDNGETWVAGADIPMPRNRFDHPDPSVPRNWIVWQIPIRDARGRYLAGYTQCTSQAHFTPPHSGWVHADSRCAFMRFENIDEGPDPEAIRITWLPLDCEGLEVPNRMYPDMSVAQEPAMVLLPDGRLFTVMRTMTGHIWYSVSDDDGETWRPTAPLRYADDGDFVEHPMAPCPLYALGDGRFLLVFHNNPGTRGAYSQFAKVWTCNQADFIRNPAFLAVGRYEPAAAQPLVFGKPKQILDTDGLPVGPKGTAEIATYTSLTEHNGRRVLWYPDRKYYLLGKQIPDELLADDS